MSSYDQKLLDAAPIATRAQLQEGYNVDLLGQPPPRRTPSTHNPISETPQPAPVTMPLTPGVAETGPEEKLTSPAYTPAASKSKPSFWRSRNGVITVVVIVLVVIGAVVGGAVGGTVKKNNNNVATSSPNPFQSPTSTPTTPTPTTASGNVGGSGVTAGSESTTAKALGLAPSTSGTVVSSATSGAAGKANVGMEVPDTSEQGFAA